MTLFFFIKVGGDFCHKKDGPLCFPSDLVKWKSPHRLRPAERT